MQTHFLQVIAKLVVLWAMPTNDIDSLQLQLACAMFKMSKAYPVGYVAV